MGIEKIASKIAIKAGKKVADKAIYNTAVAIINSNEKRIDKKEQQVIEKLFHERKNYNHLMITHQTTKGIFLSSKEIKTKLTCTDNQSISYEINIVKKDDIEKILIKSASKTTPVFDVRISRVLNDKGYYEVVKNENKMGYIKIAPDCFFAKYELATGETWQAKYNGKNGYDIYHLTNKIGFFKTKDINVRKKTFMLDYKTTESIENILYLIVILI